MEYYQQKHDFSEGGEKDAGTDVDNSGVKRTSTGRKGGEKVRKGFNLVNVLSGIGFVALILAPGALDSDMPVTAVVMISIFGICAALSLRENGKKR